MVEDHSQNYRNLAFNTQPTEITVTIKCTKGNAEGRYFLITNMKDPEVVLKFRFSYFNSKQKDTGPLHRYWSALCGKWSITRRGRRSFQEIPKKVVRCLKN